jgi:hypothetical protein
MPPKMALFYLQYMSTSGETSMQHFRSLLAGLATVAVAGLAGFAHAAEPDFKTLTVQLPGGGVEQIEYTGTVAPQVIVTPVSSQDVTPMTIALPFSPPDPLAAIAQISAEMNQQAAAMMNAMNVMAASNPASLGAQVPAVFGSLPVGGAGYSFLSSMSGGPAGACMRSVEIIAMGNGQPPRIVSHSAGDCGAAPALDGPAGAAPAGGVPAVMPTTPAPQPQLIRARDVVPQTIQHPSQT